MSRLSDLCLDVLLSERVLLLILLSVWSGFSVGCLWIEVWIGGLFFLSFLLVGVGSSLRVGVYAGYLG